VQRWCAIFGNLKIATMITKNDAHRSNRTKKNISHSGYIAKNRKMDIKKETNFFSIHPHVKIYPFLTSTLFHYILKYYKLGFGYTFLYPIQGRIQKGIYFYSLFGYFIYPKSYIYIFSILIFISKTSYMFFLLNKNISKTRYIFYILCSKLVCKAHIRVFCTRCVVELE